MKPILQALLLADHVYEDKSTGKKVIAGIFSVMGVIRNDEAEESKEPEQLPVAKPVASLMHAGSPYAYISLTDIKGTVDLVLRYVSLETHEALFETTVSVRAEDPVATVEIVMPVPKLPSEIGTFALELLCEDELLGFHRITVQEMKV